MEFDINSLIVDWAKKGQDRPRTQKVKERDSYNDGGKRAKPVEDTEAETEDNKTRKPLAKPVVFRCGHMNFEHHGKEEDHPRQVEARERGYCCVAKEESYIRYKALNPEGKSLHGFITVFWEVRGLYEPVPRHMRRDPGRSGSVGWKGMCCHQETGIYIGGTGNDCRYYNDNGDRCVVHASETHKSKAIQDVGNGG